jgi:DNA (cytosine-5)-methyltransferase 1
MLRFAEFFAGGGMARLGLGQSWVCAFANDIDAKKCAVYRSNFDSSHLVEGDIANIAIQALRQPVDLYWASSPCQDLSLAGTGKGLEGARSGAFFSWLGTIKKPLEEGFRPKIIAFENVVGLSSRRSGLDLATVCSTISDLGYKVAVLEINADLFLPQSRPRLFVLFFCESLSLNADVFSANDCEMFNQRTHHARVMQHSGLQDQWVWITPRNIPRRNVDLVDLIDAKAYSWDGSAKTTKLVDLMGDRSRETLKRMLAASDAQVGTIYKRGRPGSDGITRQRAELRADGIAGCLRTARGGSSRQTLLMTEDGQVRTRLLTAREGARLMGLPESYRLPRSESEAYSLLGDGVAVPIVKYLNDTVFLPALMDEVALSA